MFRAETADSEEEADKWYEDHSAGRRPPELLPRDEVARAINTEVKAGRGTPHGGVFLDIASRRTPEYIRRRLPSMYHQFMELAGVDITREAMEIGPTCHYFMGGVQVEADTAATTVPGLFAAGEVAAGMHGANRLGGNSLSDLIVFGRRAGAGAADYAASGAAASGFDEGEVDAAVKEALAPLERTSGENPYDIQRDLQEMMQVNVGIIRNATELERAIEKLEEFTQRAQHIAVKGGRVYNPGWNLATDLPSMITFSKCSAHCGQPAQGVTRRPHSRGLPEHRPRAREGQLRPEQRGWPLGRARYRRRVAVLEMPDDLKALLEEAT